MTTSADPAKQTTALTISAELERRPDGTFAAGRSGNPSGRPRATPAKPDEIVLTTIDMSRDRPIRTIARDIVDLALHGKITADTARSLLEIMRLYSTINP